MKLFTWLKHFFAEFKAFRNPSRRRPVYYRISSIDDEHQTVILNVIHKSIFFTRTFAEIISNAEIIEGLSSQQACWLGVYYGRALKAALHGKQQLKNIKNPNYLLQHKYGRYKIISEHRDGRVTCINVKTKKELSAQPISIAKDDIFIKNFDASQACYIGILAGIAMEKKQLDSLIEIKSKSVPYLKVVK